MQENFVPIGIGPPMYLPVTILSTAVDLTVPTGLTFNVTYPDGSVNGWSGFILSATKTQLLGGHAFSVSDVQQDGYYFLEPLLAASGGSIPCRPFAIRGGSPETGV